MDWATYGWHFAAGALCSCVTFGCSPLGGMGGGDAKLMAATAVWMGFGIHLVEYLVISAFLGGVLTVAHPQLSQIRRWRSSRAATCSCATSPTSRVGVPYGIALGIGGLITYPDFAADGLGAGAPRRPI